MLLGFVSIDMVGPNGPELIPQPELAHFPFESFGSRLPDLTGLGHDLSHDVAGIDDALGPIGQFLVIHGLVVGGDQDGIAALEHLTAPDDRLRAGPVRMLAGWPNDRNIGVVIAHFGAQRFEQIHEHITG